MCLSERRRTRRLRAAGLALLGTLSLALAACDSDTITVTPANQMTGQVLDPFGKPVGSAIVGLYELRGSSLGTQYDTRSTLSDGTFIVDFPRHRDVDVSWVVTAPSAYSFPLTGFGYHSNITVDLVSTVLYEMLTNTANNGCSPNVFTPSQLDAFLSQARTYIAAYTARNLIQNTVSPEKLRKAYQNALSSDPKLLAMIKTAALLNPGQACRFNDKAPFYTTNRLGFSPAPAALSPTPSTHTPPVNENQTLPLTIQGVSYNTPPDQIFYAWTIQPVKGADPLNCDVTRDSADGDTAGDVVLGPPQLLSATTYAYNFTPSYDTVSWDKGTAAYKIVARVSTGGPIYINNKNIWCVTVTNVRRSPVFSSAAPKTALEDAQWTYTPTAASPDGAPVNLQLVTGTFPAGMDMCINTQAYPLTPSWKWQVAGTACSSQNLITWTPTNCQSTGPQFVNIQASDPFGTAGYQGFNITVTDNNIAPTITSLPPAAPNPVAAEATAWTYQVQVSDPQADPAAQPAAVSGNNPAPYAGLTAPYTANKGGLGCADPIGFSFVQSPSSATIHPTTGLVSWTPSDTETGQQTFTIRVSDSHGGSADQSFVVSTQNTEQSPYYISPAASTTILIAAENYVASPAGVGITVGDADYSDNNIARLSVNATGLPPGATTTWTPDGLGRPTLSIAWPITDADTPSNYPVALTLCDSNIIDMPLGAIVAPAYSVMGPPHNHICVPMTVTLDAPKRNFAPMISSSPPALAVGNSLYTYNLSATDGNVTPADTVHFQLLGPATTPTGPAPPAGLVLNETGTTAPTATATITWTPNNTTHLGFHTIKVKAYDGNAYPGGAHEFVQTITIFVQEANTAPSFTSACPAGAQDGTQLVYNATATDADTTNPNNKLTYSLLSGLSGMAIDSKTGKFTWNPTVAQAQNPTATFTIGVQDGGTTPTFAAVTQTCVLAMTYVNLAPVADPIADATAPVNMTLSGTITASDPDGDPIALTGVGLPAGSVLTDNGDGTANFTWTPTAIGVTTLTFNAQDTYGGGLHHNSTTTWKVTVVDAPIFQSTPLTATNINGSYSYEIHAIDTSGGGLTFTLDTGPSGMQIETDPGTQVKRVTWTASGINVGSNNVVLRATDANGRATTQTWAINVTIGANSAPTISATTPDYNTTSSVTEGRNSSFTVSAADSNGDPLHYSWYWDGVWVYDKTATYAYLPNSTSAGTHTLRVEVSDGASTASVDIPVRVRDAMPVLGSSYTVPGGSLLQFAMVPSAQEVVTLQGGGTPRYSIYTESGFASGAIGSVTGFAFTPARMVIQNDFATSTYLYTYFAANGDVEAGTNQYYSVPSDTLSLASCPPALCFAKIFSSQYMGFGGAKIGYKTAAVQRFNINSTNRRYLSSTSNGVANADADLGVGVSASSLLYDTYRNKVYITVSANSQVLVVDPATRAITATINLPGGSKPSAMHMNSVSHFLYTYNSGTGSISEIDTATNVVNSTSLGMAAAPSIGNDPANVFAANDVDNIYYVANPDNGVFYTFDANYGTYKTISGQGASVVHASQITGAAFGASYGNGKILRMR